LQLSLLQLPAAVSLLAGRLATYTTVVVEQALLCRLFDVIFLLSGRSSGK